MDGDLDIEGNLYQALDNFLGQMGKFSTDEHHLKSIMFPSSSKKNQKKKSAVITISEMTSTNSGSMKQ